MKNRKLTLADFEEYHLEVEESFFNEGNHIGFPLEFSQAIRKKYPHWEEDGEQKAKLDKIDDRNKRASALPYGDCSSISWYELLYKKEFEDYDAKFLNDFVELCVNETQERIDATWEVFEEAGLGYLKTEKGIEN